ncbi:MAG TPA: ZIP family metal transporter, partial [Candidatus Pacebacteria bacterium]|nr:ZIP family metal transporter [Candidatus Paceibacterota bacterium]
MKFDSLIASLVAVFLVSLVSLVGLVTLSFSITKLRRQILILISFAAGTLLGDVFWHLVPEIVGSKTGWTFTTSASVLAGISLSLILEKIIHWRHCHLPITVHHQHHFAGMNLFGDGLHNFLDGVIIAASFITSFPMGVATTLAVLAHEIPQEIGDFGVLIHSGFSRKKALWLNFLTALTAVLGVLVAVMVSNITIAIETVLLPFAVGSFLYIAGSDLIPELH